MDVFTRITALVGKITPNSVQLLGSAFLISSNGLYATSRHVIGNNTTGIVVLLPHIDKINDYQDVSDKKCAPIPVEISELDPIRDIAILKADVRFTGIPPIIGSLDEVNVGETIHIFGFPHCVEGRRVLTLQTTEIGAKILLESNKIKSKHAVINIQSRPGQSGSMVFSPRLQKTVGILVGTYAPQFGIMLGNINPAELNQTTHIISSEYIKSMI